MTVMMALAVAALTSCSSPAEEDQDAIAVGEDGVAGSIQLRSMLFVAPAEGEPGRLLGTLNNESDEALEVTLNDAADEVTVTVSVNGQYPFDTNEAIFTTTGDAPGANTLIMATVDGETAKLLIPVRDGTLEQYRPYLPD